jgi:hypothetical protein
LHPPRASAIILKMSESDQRIKLNNSTLTKEEQKDLLRSFLPACQPQEGSPPNTFTQSELDDLKKALPNMQIGPRDTHKNENSNKIDICNPTQFWEAPPTDQQLLQHQSASPQDDCMEFAAAPPQDGSFMEEEQPQSESPQEAAASSSDLDWHGAPRFHKQVNLSRAFRQMVRAGEFTTPTNGVCPGFLQCNLVVLPQGPGAFDFLLFCQRNPKSCPLIEVCDVGSPYASGVAPGADLRTDIPK